MAECILEFLKYGAPAEPIAALSETVTAPFLPALVLASADSPGLMPSLLRSLSSHRQVPRALVYAGLNYAGIALSVLEAEAKGAEVGEKKNVVVEDTAAKMEVVEEEEEDEPGGGGEESSLELQWKSDYDDDVADECYSFEVADERERVRLAVLSLRRNGCKFLVETVDEQCFTVEEASKQENDRGSIWNNEVFLPELLCLLPIAAARCPTLLTPEFLVKGLLSASSGCPLLVTTLMNNPGIVERGTLVLASIFACQAEISENHPGSPPPSSEATSASAAKPVLSARCVHTMTLVLVSLCRVAPSMAAACREALVSTCTLAEMAMHITLEIFHDELQFLSKLIFPMERTSRWILSFLGASNQKLHDNQHCLFPLPSLLDDDKSKFPTWGVLMRVRDSLLADAVATGRKQGWCGRLHAHLRLYCILIRAADLQPTHDEVDFWIRALGGTLDFPAVVDHDQTRKTPPFVSERTLQLGICFVCLVPGLSNPSTKSLLHACIANLLRASMGNVPSSCCTPEIELAVWVAVQLLLRRFPDIAGLVRKSLGMHVIVHSGSMRDLAEAAGVLSDAFVAANAAAALRPSGPIPSSRMHQCLGLKCLEQLLNRGTFAQCAVDISDTVMHYICIAGEPIHPVLPLIVHGFAELSAPAPPRARQNVPRFRMRPFSQASLVKAMAPGFAILRNSLASMTTSATRLQGSMKGLSSRVAAEKNGTGDPLATAALVTYYIFCREQIAWSLGTSGGVNHENSNSAVNGHENGWWSDLLSDLPLRELLMYMELNWPAYEHLLPQWLCIASVVFPHRFTARSLLRDLEKTEASFQIHVKGIPITEDLDWVPPLLASPVLKNEADVLGDLPLKTEPEVVGSPMSVDKENEQTPLSKPLEVGQHMGETESYTRLDKKKSESVAESDLQYVDSITAAMENAVQHPLFALRVLKAMMKGLGLKSSSGQNLELMAGFGVDWSLETAMMKGLIPHLLSSSCPRCLQDQFCSWWRAVPSSCLEYLGPIFWDLIRDPRIPASGHSFRFSGKPQITQSKQSEKPKAVTLSTSGLVEEPLKLLACKREVFRSPILSIFLELLLELLAANRRICELAIMDGSRDAAIKREEVSGAIVAQDSAVCQILLEACLSSTELGDEEVPGPLLEAHALICATLCSMLQRSPLLLKLLHFQGYDIKLIPMMVKGVPATVQCLDFIGELLQQSQQQRLVFATALTAQLVKAHPDLPQSLDAAQQVVGQATQMQTKVAGCAEYLQEVLGPVAQCASTFSSLAPQVIALLQSCAQAAGPLMRSGPPRDPTLHAAALAAFKFLIQGKLLHGRPLPAM